MIKTIFGNTPQEMDSKVNEHLKQGWELRGETFTFLDNNEYYKGIEPPSYCSSSSGGSYHTSKYVFTKFAQQLIEHSKL